MCREIDCHFKAIHLNSEELFHDDVIKWGPYRVTGPLSQEFTGEFPAQMPVKRSFDVFFDLRRHKRLSKQSWRRWCEKPSRSLCRHCIVHDEIEVHIYPLLLKLFPKPKPSSGWSCSYTNQPLMRIGESQTIYRATIMLHDIIHGTRKQSQISMMMSSKGTIFRVTGPLWGEFTGHRWIPLTKASDAELWRFLCYTPERTRDAGGLRRHRTHYDVTVISIMAADGLMYFWKLTRNISTLVNR